MPSRRHHDDKMMMMMMNNIFVVLMVLITALSSTTTQALIAENNNDDCFLCYIAKPEIMLENGSEYDEESSPPVCLHQRSNRGFREAFRITLSPEFLAKHASTIDGGGADFCIPGGHISSSEAETETETETEDASSYNSIIVPEERLIRLQHSTAIDDNNNNNDNNSDQDGGHRRQQRHLEDKDKELRIGTKKLLAVRVISKFDEIPVESVDDIETAIFGADDDSSIGTGDGGGGFGTGVVAVKPKATVVEQYHKVSHGKLQLMPAQGSNIYNGVAQVEISQRVNDSSIDEGLGTNILARTEQLVGVPLEEVADFIVFCLPDGSTARGKLEWTAYTFIYHPYSYYQRSSCTKLSFVMHEVGHSIGFPHSGLGDDNYADESGYMGYSVQDYGGPRKAFNAHKHWFSGWFHDRRRILNNPTQTGHAFQQRLVSFVDYNNNPSDDIFEEDDMVLLNLANNLYIQYNAAKGYNLETPYPYKNKVMITQANGHRSDSKHLAALSAGQSYSHSFFGSNYQLIIHVCEIVQQKTADGAADDGPGSSSSNLFDYAILSVHVDDGLQEPACSQPLRPSPSAEKSPRPSIVTASPPTKLPSFAPTNSISVSPTMDASTPPSTRISAAPSSGNHPEPPSTTPSTIAILGSTIAPSDNMSSSPTTTRANNTNPEITIIRYGDDSIPTFAPTIAPAKPGGNDSTDEKGGLKENEWDSRQGDDFISIEDEEIQPKQSSSGGGGFLKYIISAIAAILFVVVGFWLVALYNKSKKQAAKSHKRTPTGWSETDYGEGDEDSLPPPPELITVDNEPHSLRPLDEESQSDILFLRKTNMAPPRRWHSAGTDTFPRGEKALSRGNNFDPAFECRSALVRSRSSNCIPLSLHSADKVESDIRFLRSNNPPRGSQSTKNLYGPRGTPSPISMTLPQIDDRSRTPVRSKSSGGRPMQNAGDTFSQSDVYFVRNNKTPPRRSYSAQPLIT